MRNKVICGVGLVASAMVLSAGIHAATLGQAISRAIDTHPEVHAALHQVLSRKQEVKQAKSGYLPTLDVAAGIGKETTESPTTGQNRVKLTRHETSVAARQMLFDGFATRSEVRRQQARTESSESSLASSKELIALRAAEVYIAMITQLELLKLAEGSLEEHKSIHDQMVLRNESGVGSKADLDQVAARLALSQSNLVLADASVKDAVTNYYRVVGEMPVIDDLALPESEAQMPAGMDEATAMALDLHPTLKTANADIRATVAQHEASASPFWPDLRIEADKSWNEDVGGVVGDDERGVIALRARYNLYRGGADKARRKQTSYLLEESKDVRNNTRRQVVEGLRLSWTAYESIRGQLKFLHAHVASSEATKEAYIKQFNIGKRTLLDLLNTENEVVDSRRNLIRAINDQKLAEYRVYNSMGVLLKSLGVR